MNVYYYIPSRGETKDEAVQVSICTWEKRDAHHAAAQCAEHYHNYRLGFEEEWPVTLVLLGPNRELWGTWEVERECVPQFTAKLAGVGKVKP